MSSKRPATQFEGSDGDSETEDETLKSPPKKAKEPVKALAKDSDEDEEVAANLKYCFGLLEVRPLISFLNKKRCGICRGLLHAPASLVPCLHSFCGGCISTWIESHSDCPQCRKQTTQIAKNHQLESIVDLFAKSHPTLKRTGTEIADLDSRNKVGNDPLGGGGSNHFYDDEDDDDEGDPDDDDHDNDEDDEEPTTCQHCPPNSTATDGFSCNNVDPDHINCSRCHLLMPQRDLPIQKCKLCSTPSCHLYYASSGGCPSNFDFFKKLQDFTFTDIPPASFNNNPSERQFFLTICNTNSISVNQVFQAGMSKLLDGTYVMTSSSLRDMDSNLIPQSIKGRPDCWYGRECRTQRHNQSHASRLNHICECIKK
ncbi:hypothetical protein BDR26DRAFT_899386 [Obelidium mucronatum]|nr:hypothetical protein BDR26DRAFT_899386 [Obelidium mucronatum]